MHESLDFYYDFISPNAYLAWLPLRELAKEHQRDLVLKPVLFAGLLQAHGQVGPAEVAPKMRWMVRNCLRKAKHLGVDLAPPHSHPFNPLLALRVALASAPDDMERVTDVLFRATWAQSRDVTDIDTVSKILDESGIDATGLIEAAGSLAVKDQLRKETESAVSRGVFGVPTVIVDQELFFGFDDLPWLEQYLRGQDRNLQSEYEAWLTVRPSAWRNKR